MIILSITLSIIAIALSIFSFVKSNYYYINLKNYSHLRDLQRKKSKSIDTLSDIEVHEIDKLIRSIIDNPFKDHTKQFIEINK